MEGSIKTLAVASLMALATLSNAALVTLEGDSFDIVYDDTQVGVFGAPQLSGDTVYFLPTNFYAAALNDEGVSLGRSTINFTVKAHDGYKVDSVAVLEEGDYFTLGDSASVSLRGQIRARNLEQPAVGLVDNFQVSDLNTQEEANWSATASLDVGALAADELGLTIQNVLFSRSLTLGDYAFIEKKFIGASVNVVQTPIPAAGFLFATGLISLAVGRRKKN